MPRQSPAFLKAIGRQSPPETVSVNGRTYHLYRVYKHDFFALTARYDADAGSVLLKVQRTAPLLGLPMAWVGRLLASREWAALKVLEGVSGVPRPIQRLGPTGLVREFVAGHPLARGERVPDDFHPRLRELVQRIHAAGMAYVDLEKCENVLVGEDGRPYLFDFQISWHWPRRWGGESWPLRRVRAILQGGDLYHLVKLQRRTRRDQLTEEELAASYRRPWYVRLHRFLTRPFLLLRRALLNRIDPRRGDAERGRVG